MTWVATLMSMDMLDEQCIHPSDIHVFVNVYVDEKKDVNVQNRVLLSFYFL